MDGTSDAVVVLGAGVVARANEVSPAWIEHGPYGALGSLGLMAPRARAPALSFACEEWC